MQQHVGQMMPAGILHTVNRAVQDMRNPRERMPVAGAIGREGPSDFWIVEPSVRC